jgi:DNA-binding transcriptional LysR family regulator
MDSKRFDLNLLATLEALLAEQNVTKAAARLNLSQPAVSAQLNRLRDLFDDQLFVPAHRGMIPTPKANELRDSVRHVLELARATVTSHRSFDPASAELVVAIASTDYLQAAVAGPFLAGLRSRAPGMRVALTGLDIGELEEQMARGDIDLALMTPGDAPANLRSRPLFQERYVLIGRRGHPMLNDRLSVSDYVELEHVIVSLRGAEFSTPVDTALKALGYRRRVMASASSFLFVIDIVASTDFVALAPESLVAARQESLVVVEPPFPVEGFEVGMVWHERTHDHIGQRWIREEIGKMATSSRRPAIRADRS